MIRVYSRGLNSDERLLLRKDCEFASDRQMRWKHLTWCTIPIGLAIGIPLALGQADKDPALGYLAFGTVAVYILIFAWTYCSNTKDDRRRVKANRIALRNNQAEVTHCRSEEVLQLEETDLPNLYFFQVEEDTILFCELYKEDAHEKDFPNSEFEVVKVYDNRKQLLVLELACKGKILQPMEIEADQQRELLRRIQLPEENFVVMDGTLGELTWITPKRSVDN